MNDQPDYSINANREAEHWTADDDNWDAESTASFAADRVYQGAVRTDSTRSSFSDLNEQLQEKL